MRLFLYFSEIQGRRVYDADKAFVGRVTDVALRIGSEVFPRSEALIIKRGFFVKKYAVIHMQYARKLGKSIKLNVSRNQIKFYPVKIRCDFSLCRDILDQQVVDTDDQKVVRVNDVHILRVDNQLYVAHVDVGLRGLARRLGWSGLIDGIMRFFFPDSAYLKEEELISWKHTQLLNIGRLQSVLRSDMARQRLAKIPSTELADIMKDLDMFEKISLFKTFSVEQQRRVFTDMAPQEKEELVDQLSDREAGNLLENIPADEATDLLHDLEKDKVKQLMRFMHSETSKKLRKLLLYAEDSAGGLMTTEYLALGKEATVQDAMNLIKKSVDYPGNIFFVYILDEQKHLAGTTSLRRFISKDPQTPLLETCFPKEVFVRTDDGVEEVALLLEKYKFSSIPVLDENDILQGVITSDDVMEELIGLTWKKYRDQI